MSITNFMSWVGGVDLFATTPGSTQPNVIVHVARAVTTPLGTAPSGLVFFQPDASQPPLFAGFVCTDAKLGAYYGPNIFAGTPFENMPVLEAEIEITETESLATATLKIEGFVIETTLSEFGPMEKIERPLGAPMPFTQQGVEAHARKATLKINGEEIALSALLYSLESGGSSVWSPGGTYTR
jgi:hypothetical protein